jgi:hypothetical protein
MFGLSLLWIGMIFRFIYEPCKSKAAGSWRLVRLCVVGFLLGGCNYMTALVMAVCSILGLFILLMIKFGKFELKGDGRVNGLWAAFICQLVGLIVSAVAPGNQIRGTKMGDMNPVKVVLRAYYSVFDICFNDMMRWEVILLLGLVAIIAWKMAEKMAYEVQHPVVFAVFSLSMMACCVAPPLYAVGDISATRIRSTMWMQFVVMMVLTIVYMACWIRKMVKGLGFADGENSGVRSGSGDVMLTIASSTAVVVIALLLIFGSMLSVFVNPRYYCATSALSDLASGDAKIYLEEKMYRLEVLQDASVTDPIFEPHTVKPELLFQSDMYTDPNLWENGVVATYYGKNSVRVSE